jgi:hypothetical protein
MILWDEFSIRIDWPQAVRGASTGFTVLVIGGLAGPLMATVPVVGQPWLLVVAVVAFAVAAWRTGDALSPALHGATAAVVSFLLVFPLLLIIGGRLGFDQLAFYSGTAIGMAIATGTAVGAVRGARRGH